MLPYPVADTLLRLGVCNDNKKPELVLPLTADAVGEEKHKKHKRKHKKTRNSCGRTKPGADMAELSELGVRSSGGNKIESRPPSIRVAFFFYFLI